VTIFQAFIMGIIQGLTEFLPISSSAHLVLVPQLLGWSFPEDQIFPFNVLVQMGTLLAVIVYFWKDLFAIVKDFFACLLKKQQSTPAVKLGWMIILATIPAGIIGVLLKDAVEMVFNSPLISVLFLLVTALILFIAEKVKKGDINLEKMTWRDALWIGLAQALAIFPGISRSGATISGAMIRNFDKHSSTRFSFLISIPIMFVAGLLSMLDLFEVNNLAEFLPVMVIGFLTAGVVGYLSIHYFLKFVRRISLIAFSIYCAVFSGLCIIFMYAF